MTDSELLSEIHKLRGKTVRSSVLIEKRMVDLYCRCLDDNNPKWQHVVPPGIILTPMISESGVKLGIPEAGPRGVDAGATWEVLKPIRVGDTIHTTHEFLGAQDKSSEKGFRLLYLFKCTHENQNGELVAVTTNRIMFF